MVFSEIKEMNGKNRKGHWKKLSRDILLYIHHLIQLN